jgi:RNA polymerase sigma factor (TIGR02999 family)
MLPPKDMTAPSGRSLENEHENEHENEQTLSDWMVFLYSELRRLAHYYLEQERPNHTLQATALVHEAYLRLLEQRDVNWQSRTQVLGLAAQMMRRILLDYSRGHESAKRGGNVNRVFLEESSLVSKGQAADVIVLDEALTRLAQVDAQHARVVELRFFGGLSIEETAEVLEVSPATVKRNWNVAKAWLARELRGK